MTLRTKTSLLLAVLVVAVVIGNGEVMLRFHEASLRQNILAAAQATAQSATETLAGFLDHNLQDVRVIAAGIPVDAVQRRDRAALESRLAEAMRLHPKFENGLFLLDAQGKFLADYPAHPELAGTSLAYREYFRSTLERDRGVVGEPYRSVRTGQPVVTSTAPIRDRQGRIVAVLAASVRLLSSGPLGAIRTQRLGRTGYLYVFDTSRLMILHPDETRVLQRDVKPGVNRLFDAAIAGYEGVGETVNSKGIPMLAAVKRVPGTNWILVSQQTASEVFAPVAGARRRLAAITLGTLLAALAFGWWAVRRLTGPLVRLKGAAEQVSRDLAEGHGLARSDAVHEIAVRRHGDEIGLLAAAFEALAARLDRAVGTLRSSARDWQLTFDSVTNMVFVTDAAGRIQRANRAACARFDRSMDALQDAPLEEVLFGPRRDDRPSVVEEGQTEVTGLAVAGEFELRVTRLQRDESAAAAGFVSVLRDVTAAKEAARKIEEMAYFDGLTGLPNRRLVLDRLAQALRVAGRYRRRVAVMYIDLDHFKEVNDSHGHSAGDLLLQEAARRIRACLRRTDTVGRFGGDEFVVVLDEARTPEDAALAAAKILDALAPEIDLGTAVARASASIGIAFYPDHGGDLDQVLAAADHALYQVKQSGRGAFRVFVGPAAGGPEPS